MIEKDISLLTKEELSDEHFIKEVLLNADETERIEIVELISNRAKELKCLGKIKKQLEMYGNSVEITNNVFNIELVTNASGVPEITTDNYLKIMQEDEYINNLFYYDVFIGQIIKTEHGKKRWWTDSDDSCLRAYIESNYRIYSQQKYYDAFNQILSTKQVHPIKDIIEDKKWDGKSRIDKFLVDILGCDDDDYSREVSRMIFYGGINRLYNPGCKFDYLPIFIGDQGCGKSSIINWLALDDKYYKDISSIEGKEAMEALQGTWICEMAELLAMVRAKEVEAMKAFITRTSDKFRKAYDRRNSENPRQCIFIGTTNDYDFLIDKTGNRRYLPIEVNTDGVDLYNKKDYVQNYILECWREALFLMKKGKTYLTIPSDYKSILENMQTSMVIDDPKIGLIFDYLDKQEMGAKVCGLEIYTKCLNNIRKNYGISDARELSRIMKNKKDWIKCDRFYTPDYGQQRGWEKVGEYEKKKNTVKIQKEWDDLD